MPYLEACLNDYFTTENATFDLKPFGPELTAEGLRPKEDL